LIELNKTFDMAKSIFGQLEKLAGDAAQFTVERPGLSDGKMPSKNNAMRK